MAVRADTICMIVLGCCLAACTGKVGVERATDEFPASGDATNTTDGANDNGESAGGSTDPGTGDPGSGDSSGSNSGVPPGGEPSGPLDPVDVPPAPPVMNDGTVTARATASRVSGVAPVAILFDATATTGTARPFHDLHFSWSFDDPGSGAWATTAHGKNTATGAVAAHVFTEPGSYEVSVTVRDAEGKGSTASVIVNVESPDAHWLNATTCVSASAEFSGCPAGAEQITTTSFASIASAVKPGRRVLLRRGDRWAASETLSLDGGQPGMLGAFGGCSSPDARGICANAPEITSNQSDAIISVQDDWRVMDLKLTGRTDGTSQNGIEIYSGTSTLIYRIRSVGFNLGVVASFIQDQLAMVDCDIGQAHTNQAYLASERLMVLGNHIHESSISHVLRIWHAYKSVISENLIESASVSTSDGRHALKLHGLGEGDGGESTGLSEATTPAGGPAHRTELTIVADNTFGASPPWPVSIGPQNTISDERVGDIILERNFWRTSGRASSSAPPLDTGIHCTAVHDITIRNNIFDATGAASGFAALDVSKSEGIPVGVSRVHFLNNLVYRSDNAGGSFTMVRTFPDVQGTVVRNNLGVAPRYSAPSQRIVEDLASGTVAQNNSFMSTTFVEDAPTAPADFRPSEGAACIDEGIDSVVIDDFARVIRPTGNATDLGPYEYVAP